MTRVHAGDQLVLETAGGGGYGDPANRDPEAVRDDVRNRKVTKFAALADYGVEVDL